MATGDFGSYTSGLLRQYSIMVVIGGYVVTSCGLLHCLLCWSLNVRVYGNAWTCVAIVERILPQIFLIVATVAHFAICGDVG
jgi:hypothetical protein